MKRAPGSSTGASGKWAGSGSYWTRAEHGKACPGLSIKATEKKTEISSKHKGGIEICVRSPRGCLPAAAATVEKYKVGVFFILPGELFTANDIIFIRGAPG